MTRCPVRVVAFVLGSRAVHYMGQVERFSKLRWADLFASLCMSKHHHVIQSSQSVERTFTAVSILKAWQVAVIPDARAYSQKNIFANRHRGNELSIVFGIFSECLCVRNTRFMQAGD